jgi:hypothetical protein
MTTLTYFPVFLKQTLELGPQEAQELVGFPSGVWQRDSWGKGRDLLGSPGNVTLVFPSSILILPA